MYHKIHFNIPSKAQQNEVELFKDGVYLKVDEQTFEKICKSKIEAKRLLKEKVNRYIDLIASNTEENVDELRKEALRDIDYFDCVKLENMSAKIIPAIDSFEEVQKEIEDFILDVYDFAIFIKKQHQWLQNLMKDIIPVIRKEANYFNKLEGVVVAWENYDFITEDEIENFLQKADEMIGIKFNFHK